jgi:hypothetical protein
VVFEGAQASVVADDGVLHAPRVSKRLAVRKALPNPPLQPDGRVGRFAPSPVRR